jgi:hypothetical protein
MTTTSDPDGTFAVCFCCGTGRAEAGGRLLPDFALEASAKGTRCGFLDPGEIFFLHREGWSIDQIDHHWRPDRSSLSIGSSTKSAR